MSVSQEGFSFPWLWISKLEWLARKGDLVLGVSMGKNTGAVSVKGPWPPVHSLLAHLQPASFLWSCFSWLLMVEGITEDWRSLCKNSSLEVLCEGWGPAQHGTTWVYSVQWLRFYSDDLEYPVFRKQCFILSCLAEEESMQCFRETTTQVVVVVKGIWFLLK